MSPTPQWTPSSGSGIRHLSFCTLPVRRDNGRVWLEFAVGIGLLFVGYGANLSRALATWNVPIPSLDPEPLTLRLAG